MGRPSQALPAGLEQGWERFWLCVPSSRPRARSGEVCTASPTCFGVNPSLRSRSQLLLHPRAHVVPSICAGAHCSPSHLASPQKYLRAPLPHITPGEMLQREPSRAHRDPRSPLVQPVPRGWCRERVGKRGGGEGGSAETRSEKKPSEETAPDKSGRFIQLQLCPGERAAFVGERAAEPAVHLPAARAAAPAPAAAAGPAARAGACQGLQRGAQCSLSGHPPRDGLLRPARRLPGSGGTERGPCWCCPQPSAPGGCPQGLGRREGMGPLLGTQTPSVLFFFFFPPFLFLMKISHSKRKIWKVF